MKRTALIIFSYALFSFVLCLVFSFFHQNLPVLLRIPSKDHNILLVGILQHLSQTCKAHPAGGSGEKNTLLAHGLFSLHADGVCLSVQNGGAQAHGISNGCVNVVRLHAQRLAAKRLVDKQRIALDIR